MAVEHGGWLFALRRAAPQPDQDECLVMLDSGAELHVCPKEWCMSCARNNEDPEKELRLADGASIAAHGRRTVRLELLDTPGFQCDSTFVACDVAIPIWSVGQLAREGHQRRFEDAVFWARGGVAIKMHQYGSLFYVRVKPQQLLGKPPLRMIAPVGAPEPEEELLPPEPPEQPSLQTRQLLPEWSGIQREIRAKPRLWRPRRTAHDSRRSPRQGRKPDTSFCTCPLRRGAQTASLGTGSTRRTREMGTSSTLYA